MSYGIPNGLISQGGSFNGTSSRIVATSALTTLANSTTGTVSLWVKPILSTNLSNYPFEMWNGPPYTYFIINFFNTTGNKYFYVDFWVDNIQRWRIQSATDTISIYDGKWTHIAITHDGTTPRLYINKSVVGTVVGINQSYWFKALITDAVTKADKFPIGYDTAGGTNYKGDMEELFISKSVVWSQNDVSKYYSRMKGFYR
jgi:hypothetical protein